MLLSYSVFVAGVSAAVGDTVSLSCIVTKSTNQVFVQLILGTNVCMSSFYYTVIIKSLHNNNRLGVRLLLLYCTTCSCQVSAGCCVRE